MADWNEIPMFVDHGDDHIAAVVTVPPGQPRSLVLLLQGWGASRSHRNRIWTRLARSLAARGIASVRFDYPGIGDSTGEGHPDLRYPPVEEAISVLETAEILVPGKDVAIVGNCLGARTAFAVAARLPTCRAVCAILVRKPSAIVESRDSSGMRQRANARLRRRARAKRTLRRIFGRHMYHRLRLVPDAVKVIRDRPCLLMCVGERAPASRLERDVRRIVGRRRQPGTQVMHVASPPLIGFRIPLHLQPKVILALVEWLDRALPADGAVRVPATMSDARGGVQRG